MPATTCRNMTHRTYIYGANTMVWYTKYVCLLAWAHHSVARTTLPLSRRLELDNATGALLTVLVIAWLLTPSGWNWMEPLKALINSVGASVLSRAPFMRPAPCTLVLSVDTTMCRWGSFRSCPNDDVSSTQPWVCRDYICMHI